MLLRLALIGLTIPLFAAAQTKPGDTHTFEPFVVTGKRPTSGDMEGPDGIRTYDESEIEATGVFTLQEFFETLPRGTGEEQLILVDGVPTELTALTPAMVASIEVSYSGSMPQYGAFSRGRIINVRLKTEYSNREFGLQVTSSFNGDAGRREVNFSGGVIRGPWRLFYGGEYSRTDALTSDARDFSREQDHRAAGGRDFRLPWGDTATVQAVSGNLNGVFNASGNPVPVALVPENASGPLTPAQFTAGVGPSAAGQRFFNTSPYLYLQSPGENLGANLRVMRAFKKVQVNVMATHSMRASRREGPPPVTAASTATLVPAALNPFGQDVLVGLVHTGFGPVVQESDGNNSRVSLSANWSGGRGGGGGGAEGPVTVMGPGVVLGDRQNVWNIFGNLSFSRSQSENATRDLDPAALTAALAAANPAARFNPFVGANSPANAALYPALAVDRTQENANRATQLTARAFGPLADGWGAGPVRLMLNGNASWRQDERTSRNLRGVADGVVRNYDASYGLTSRVSVPLLKEQPRAYRLETSLTGNYVTNNHGSATRRGGLGLFWVPVRALSLNADYTRNTASPGDRGDDDPNSTLETLMDPRRMPAVAENVQVISRRSASTESSRGDYLQLNATFDVPFRPGLRLTSAYTQQRSNRATGRPFRPQDVIDNETLFTDRIVRETPTAADVALGQPGRILVVDTTASAVARDQERTLNLGIEFRWPAMNNPAGGRGGGRGPGGGVAPTGRGAGGRGAGQAPGPARALNVHRFTFNLDADIPLESRYEVAEGQNFISRESGPANRPDWTARGNLRWNNRRWAAGLNIRHAAASQQRTIPAITSVGGDVSYRFENAFWGKFGKNLRLRLQLQNLGRDEPPYADVILGYRGGSPVGTTASFSVNTPW